jgi:nucleotide-binding universal stress UspA family protein
LKIYELEDSGLNYAIELAHTISASISVVYVFYIYNYYNYDTAYDMSYMEDLMNHYSNELARRVKEVRVKRGIRNGETSKLEIKTEVIMGLSPSVTIVEYASRKSTDLIVMNTHGRKGIKKFILGSVTEKVIQESPCAVLALRP